MPIKLINDDITKIKCDAIVNAANSTLLGGGGVDGAIHKAAGKLLLEECRTLGGCKTGQAKITKGYNLPAKYVIHTVGPIWEDGSHNEKKLLTNCYLNSIKLAIEYNCKSIAFPIISSGVYGYPKIDALNIAIDTISSAISNTDIVAYIVIFSDIKAYLDNDIYNDVKTYISNKDLHLNENIQNCEQFDSINERNLKVGTYDYDKIKNIVDNLDESFSEMILRKIDEKHMSDVECYKKANIDRKLFSKIRSNINYKPSKRTAIALGIALELKHDEMDDLLNKAGYSLSKSNKFDLIIKYFIENNIYDIYTINKILFAFDQQLLGQ